MRIGDIIKVENYSEAVKWCNNNNAKLEEIEPILENVKIQESGFVDDEGDYIILEEEHFEQQEVRRFKIVEIPVYKPTKEEVAERRRSLYIEQKDPLTCQIQALRDEPQTEEILNEIEYLQEERRRVVEKIKKDNPYPISSEVETNENLSLENG